ncbi:MAG: UDP-N-acetylmuramoyl-tripeptide--D-alanyl-D-alanine ligase [Nesterenkonia sp.]
MIPMTAAEIAEAVSGEVHGISDAHSITVTDAGTDSRHIGDGSMFIAKPGEHTDGHRFIAAARSAGAALVLAQRPTRDPAGKPDPAVIVDDVVTAMGCLASEIVTRIRAHSPTTVIGITGSAGKTTTKDLLCAVLSHEGPTTAPQGSYNGEVGVPLTIFGAQLDTRYLIIEMGADAPGNIRQLCDMVSPDIGVVLMVGTSHAEKFGDQQAIARTKGELAEAVSAGGHVLLNAEDPHVSAMEGRATAQVTRFGQRESHQVAAADLQLDDAGHPVFTLCIAGEEHRIRSGLIGAHHITNLLAAAAAAWRAGAAAADIAERMQGLGPTSRWRMERTERADGVTVINDAYNASPESMREALRTLAILTRESGRRSVAVLGAMLELGADSTMAHHRIGETVVRLNIGLTLVVGHDAYPLYRGAVAEGSWGSEVQWVETVEEAEAWLSTALLHDDVVLFKSSNGAGLRLLGDHIAAQGGAP